MPIRFRCSRCNRLLGIARRKAGAETKCPHCGATIMVPRDADDGGEEDTQFDDIDELINPAAERPSHSAAPAVAARPAPPPVPRPARSAPKPIPLPPEERPLFEREIDAVLGLTDGRNRGELKKPKHAPTAGVDALSLAPEVASISLSPQRATALAVVVVILMALSFGAGFLIGSR
jgi:DNA-directed RNA polymerase subunit RPC12/RpoP